VRPSDDTPGLDHETHLQRQSGMWLHHLDVQRDCCLVCNVSSRRTEQAAAATAIQCCQAKTCMYTDSMRSLEHAPLPHASTEEQSSRLLVCHT
jgi:hypothetical protein